MNLLFRLVSLSSNDGGIMRINIGGTPLGSHVRYILLTFFYYFIFYFCFCLTIA